MANSPATFNHRMLNNFILASQVLCCYDYFLTFPSEIEYVWSKKFSLASGLFYTLRYPAVLNTVFVALGSFPGRSWLTSHSCVIIIRFEMAGDVLILVASALFTAMRVFALFKRNKVLFAFTLGLGLIAPIISIYTFVNSHPILAEITPAYQVCYIEDASIDNLWMMGARVSSVVFDGLSFGLTWMATRPTTQAAMAFRGSKTILVMMRDTAVYFGLLFVLNVIALGLVVAHLTQFILVVSTWTAILTSILLSRLMLDLRASATDDLGTAGSNDSHTLRFWHPSANLSHASSTLSPTGCAAEDAPALDDTQRRSEAGAGPL